LLGRTYIYRVNGLNPENSGSAVINMFQVFFFVFFLIIFCFFFCCFFFFGYLCMLYKPKKNVYGNLTLKNKIPRKSSFNKNLRNSATLHVISQLLSERCFDTLRTKQQLGKILNKKFKQKKI